MRFIKFILRLIKFCMLFPLIVLCILMELSFYLPSMLFGFGNPKSQSLMTLRLSWNQLLGTKPVSYNLVNVDGYLYTEVTYSNGSKLLFR